MPSSPYNPPAKPKPPGAARLLLRACASVVVGTVILLPILTLGAAIIHATGLLFWPRYAPDFLTVFGLVLCLRVAAVTTLTGVRQN